jgi:hypothetical protein
MKIEDKKLKKNKSSIVSQVKSSLAKAMSDFTESG